MYTKCYDVSDLAVPPKEYELENPVSPLLENHEDYPTHRRFGGMGGGVVAQVWEHHGPFTARRPPRLTSNQSKTQ